MNKNKIDYTLIQTLEELQTFYDTHKTTEWIAFDTEFISEKRYFPQLCLIQVASVHGYFLIDTIKIKDLSPFLPLITDSKILKLTHAGANDYRLFYQLYQVVPQSIFDVQVAAGFVGYHYPSGLSILLKNELKIDINKSQKVSNWAERPMNDNQIQYALDDILYLEPLFKSILDKLKKLERTAYAWEEMKSLEAKEYYEVDIIRNMMKSSSLLSLSRKSQLFFMRMSKWRESEARKQNVTRNAVLDNKMMVYISKSVHQGIDALKTHRRIPKHLVYRQKDMLVDFFERPPSKKEKELISQLPSKPKNQSQQDLIFDQVDLYVRYIGHQSGISAALLLSRSELNKMKVEPRYMPEILKKGWRRELLGETVFSWFKERKALTMSFENNQLIIKQ